VTVVFFYIFTQRCRTSIVGRIGDSGMGTCEVMGRQRGSCVAFPSLCTHIRAVYHTVRFEFNTYLSRAGLDKTIIARFLRIGTTLQLRCWRHSRSHQPPFSFSLLARLFLFFYFLFNYGVGTLVKRRALLYLFSPAKQFDDISGARTRSMRDVKLMLLYITLALLLH